MSFYNKRNSTAHSNRFSIKEDQTNYEYSIKRNRRSELKTDIQSEELIKLLNMLDNEFLNITKINKNLDLLTTGLNEKTIKQYEKIKEIINIQKIEFTKTLNNLHFVIESIKSINLNSVGECDIDEIIKNANSKILAEIKCYEKYEDFIRIKDRTSTSIIYEENSASIKMNENNNSQITYKTNQSNKTNSEVDNLKLSLLVVTDIQSQEQLMKKREEKLQDINM